MSKDKENYRLNHGGLMRCCVASLDEEMLNRWQAGTALMIEGDTISCKYCNSSMICSTSKHDPEIAWRWNMPEDD